ncbi:cation efflux family [Cystoisospora suis]|uniref:Cation efflux family n=1 Tax=Cystoisospora suis TaxID=483139 RepID=A0A2C6LD23_9APIC|nr:cation efflux family [Cystoisospora suis]
MSRGKKRTTVPRPARAALVPCTEPGGATVEASIHSPSEPSLGSGKHPSSPCSSEKISQNHEGQREEKKNRGGFLGEGDKETSLSSSPLYSGKDSENEKKEKKSTSSSLMSPCESPNKKSPHQTSVEEGASAATAIPASAVSSAGCSRSNSETVYPSTIGLKYSAPSPGPPSILSGRNEGQENEEECECFSSGSCPVYKKKDEEGSKKNGCHSPAHLHPSDPSQQSCREDDADECDASHDSACVHSSSSCLHAMEGGSLESKGNPPVTVLTSSVTNAAPSLAGFSSSSLSFPQFYSGSTSSRELLYVQHPDGCGGRRGGKSGGVLRSAGHCGHHRSSDPSQVETSVPGKKNGKFPSMPPLQSHEIQASLHPSFHLHGRNDDRSSTPFLHDHEEPWRTTSAEGCVGGGGGIEERKKGEAGGGGHTSGGTHRARQKLITASMVCCVFMFVEVVAGVLSNSLALMTDASHLLSDLCAFLISLFALWVSELKGNPSMSFGYHRAEILGALLSVILIWVLTAFLIYAACFRLVDPPAVDGRLMFGTALVGTLANLFMTHILKVHSHGIGQVHAHNEDEDDHRGSHGGGMGGGGCCGSHSSSRYHAVYRPDDDSKVSDRQGRYRGHENDGQNHVHTISDPYQQRQGGEVNRQRDEHSHGGEKNTNGERKIGKEGGVEEEEECDGHPMLSGCPHSKASARHDHHRHHSGEDGGHCGSPCEGHSSHRGIEGETERNREDIEEESHGATSHVASARETPTSHWERRQQAGEGRSRRDEGRGGGCCGGDRDISQHEIHRTRPCSGSSAGGSWLSNDVYIRMDDDSDAARQYENMNLRAAYIHALGDLLQNVGVMIASGLIWWRPDWSIADPICTFIFSIFVLFTTLSILKEALNVLMEGTPIGIDARALQEDLLLIPGVVEVHDLHVWSLSVGKPSLACHLVVANEDDARSVLRKATVLCQRKYGILHTTIQTDFSSDKRSCETEAHQKCSNPMKVFTRGG